MEMEKEEIEKMNVLEQKNRIMILLGNKTCKRKETGTNSNPEYENRIELKTELTEMMIKNSMLLKSIASYNLYFQPILNMGDISVGEITEDNIECRDVMTTRMGKIDEPKIISLRTRKYDMTCMRYIRETIGIKRWQIYVESFLQTLQILKELSKKKMVHMDIHQDTLLYSVEKGRPILSGFHLLFESDELMNMESAWEQYFPEFDQYSPWCIDIYLLSKLATIKEKQEGSTLNKQMILKWCEEYMNHPKSIYNKIMNMEKREEYLLNLETHFGGYTSIKSLFEYLIEKSRTWDLHSVCILYLRIAIDAKITRFMEEYDFIQKTIDVLKSVVYSMPDARPQMEYIEKSLLDIHDKIPVEKLNEYLNKMKQPMQPSSMQPTQEPTQEPTLMQEPTQEPSLMQQRPTKEPTQSPSQIQNRPIQESTQSPSQIQQQPMQEPTQSPSLMQEPKQSPSQMTKEIEKEKSTQLDKITVASPSIMETKMESGNTFGQVPLANTYVPGKTENYVKKETNPTETKVL